MNSLAHDTLMAMSLPAALGFVRNGVFIAIIANGLIGISLVWDKILLRRPETRNLVSYVFWLGAISIFGLLLIPFGFQRAGWSTVALGLLTGILHLVAIYFYYLALQRGEASQTLAIMGGFSPLATFLFAMVLLPSAMSGAHLLPFALLTAGGFLMFLSERLSLRRMLPPVLLSSFFFGLVNVLQKIVFDHTNFVTGYVWFTLGTAIGSGLLLIP